ncbi:MAG: thiol-disulfide isomerase/thioredoxin [Gammaproteobacteria bacterium]|jgi:thiol-disulfide isomerase/thioredoxin
MTEAFNLGPFLIPTRPLILILSLLLAFVLSGWLGKKFDLDSTGIKQATEYTVWCALIGARLGFVTLNWSAYSNTPWEMFYFWQPGYSYSAGLVLGAACALWHIMRYIPEKRRKFMMVLAGSYLIAGITFVIAIESLELFRPPDMPGVSDIAPDFKLQDLSGNTVRLSDLAGRGVVLNFWATWCPPCRREMPLLNDLQKTYETRGLSIIGVNLDESPQLVKSFAKSFDLSYPIWVDATPTMSAFDSTREIFSRFGGVGLPTTLFIDKAGLIQKIYVGELSRGFLQSQATDLLAR